LEKLTESGVWVLGIWVFGLGFGFVFGSGCYGVARGLTRFFWGWVFWFGVGFWKF